MECIKCGRETDQTFCETCRAAMEKYPVKPGTVVQIPQRREDPNAKNNRRHVQITPEMQIEQLKRTVRRLRTALATVVVLTLVLLTLVYWQYRRSKLPLPGQNYSTVTHQTEAASE